MGTIGKVTAGGDTHLITSTAYGTCETAAATAAKVATIQDGQAFVLITGVTVHIKMSNSNSVANPTLNVNSTGDIAIMRYGTTRPSTSTATSWWAGAVITFTYDGTYWIMNDWLNDDTTTSISSLVIPAGTTLSNVIWHGASFLTGSSQTTRFVVPFNKVITATGVTVSSVQMITRQNGNYTHGSGSSYYVTWTVGNATVNANRGVYLSLNRTTTTNAVNNAVITINLQATFKFT